MSDKVSKKKTPSARVIAAKLILEKLEFADSTPEELAEHLTGLADSRVSVDKSEKVIGFYNKLKEKLVKQTRGIVAKFEA